MFVCAFLTNFCSLSFSRIIIIMYFRSFFAIFDSHFWIGRVESLLAPWIACDQKWSHFACRKTNWHRTSNSDFPFYSFWFKRIRLLTNTNCRFVCVFEALWIVLEIQPKLQQIELRCFFFFLELFYRIFVLIFFFLEKN